MLHNIFTICRRELRSFFTTPVGYIYLVVFIIVTNLLGLSIIFPFYTYPEADARNYLYVLAGVSTIFIAAVTMGSWADERKENTYEMLLTFPMSGWDLVLGKFLAAWLFYLLALVLTITVPWMMAATSKVQLGDNAGFFGLLDPWATVAGYIGCLLIGAMLISFGLFISGFCRNQVMAFVLTAPLTFFAYILGVDFIKMLIDTSIHFLGENAGTWLGDRIGIFAHFSNMARGMINGSDILFFVIWTAIFLLLNYAAIERRGRKDANITFAVTVILAIGIGLALNNFLIGRSIGRFDMTQDKLHTIHPATRNLFDNLTDTVTVTYFVSPNEDLPTVIRNLPRDVRDKLKSLEEVSGGHLKVELTHLRVRNLMNAQGKAGQGAVPQLGDNTEAEPENLEKTTEEKIFNEVRPMALRVPSDTGGVTTQYIYSTLKIAYQSKKEEYLQIGNPDAVPQLDYEIMSRVYRMTREKDPNVVFFAPRTNISPEIASLYMQRGMQVPPPDAPYAPLAQTLQQRENYHMMEVTLTGDDPMPEDYDALMVMQPSNLTERQQYEINRAMVEGKPVILAVQENMWDIRNKGRSQIAVTKVPLTPNINSILPNGLRVNPGVLMDANPTEVMVNMPINIGGMQMQTSQPIALPMQSQLMPGSLNRDYPATSGITGLRYLWGSPLEVNYELLEGAGFKVTEIAHSNPGSWIANLANRTALQDSDLKPPAAAEKDAPMPLMVLLEGQFPNMFAGKDRPAWPEPEQSPQGPPPAPRPPEAPESPMVPAPGKLILIGSSYAWHQNQIQMPDFEFMRACLDSIVLDKFGRDILELRQSSKVSRKMGNFGQDITYWQVIQLGLAPVALIVIGLVIGVYRLQSRKRYEESLAANAK